MARKAKAYVLDSWAVLAYLEDEPSGEAVANLIVEAHENGQPIYLSVVNAGEVWYILAREVSEAEANQAIDQLRHLGIEMVDATWQIARAAAGFKVKGKISYADCFAAALASDTRAELVTGDKEFKQVEGQVKVHWV
ncbi:MAG: type II toxin-antitoxin system VapC family toxin [Nevskiaceae bacterium]